MATLKIVVTNATRNILADAANSMGNNLTGGRRLPNSMWEIEISRSTWDRLQQHSLPGESVDDVIARIAAKGKGLN